ncbi:MAG: hypothetical protein RID53_22285 [Coleofasciculus sp. B1-GNL1-01]|uniref:hypothetical protein n=1 Tax=Coleofasciculus sp. B1-GNL1-01 TaxID=3068484 RepID=UPI0032FC175D
MNQPIDTTHQIAETLYFSLSGVDAIQGKGFRRVFGAIFGRTGYNFSSGVDLAAESQSGQGVLKEQSPLAGEMKFNMIFTESSTDKSVKLL